MGSDSTARHGRQLSTTALVKVSALVLLALLALRLLLLQQCTVSHSSSIRGGGSGPRTATPAGASLLQLNHHPSGGNTRPLHAVVVEEHHEALPYWLDAGTRNGLLLHVDAHPDLAIPAHVDDRMSRARGGTRWPDTETEPAKPSSRALIRDNDGFILQACRLGVVSTVVWVFPGWDVGRGTRHYRHKAHATPKAYLVRPGSFLEGRGLAAHRRSCSCTTAVVSPKNAAEAAEMAAAPPPGDDALFQHGTNLNCETYDDDALNLRAPDSSDASACNVRGQPTCRVITVGEDWLLRQDDSVVAAFVSAMNGGGSSSSSTDVEERQRLVDIDEDFFGMMMRLPRLEQLAWPKYKGKGKGKGKVAHPGSKANLMAMLSLLCPSSTAHDEARGNKAFRAVLDWHIACRRGGDGRGIAATQQDCTAAIGIEPGKLDYASASNSAATRAIAALSGLACPGKKKAMAAALLQWASATSSSRLRLVSRLGLCFTSRPTNPSLMQRLGGSAKTISSRLFGGQDDEDGDVEATYRICDEGISAEDEVGDQPSKDTTTKKEVLMLHEDPAEVERRLEKFERLMRRLAPFVTHARTGVATICRSVRDGYTPRRTFKAVEAGVLGALRAATAAAADIAAAAVAAVADGDGTGGSSGGGIAAAEKKEAGGGGGAGDAVGLRVHYDWNLLGGREGRPL